MCVPYLFLRLILWQVYDTVVRKNEGYPTSDDRWDYYLVTRVLGFGFNTENTNAITCIGIPMNNLNIDLFDFKYKNPWFPNPVTTETKVYLRVKTETSSKTCLLTCIYLKYPNTKTFAYCISQFVCWQGNVYPTR